MVIQYSPESAAEEGKATSWLNSRVVAVKAEGEIVIGVKPPLISRSTFTAILLVK